MKDEAKDELRKMRYDFLENWTKDNPEATQQDLINSYADWWTEKIADILKGMAKEIDLFEKPMPRDELVGETDMFNSGFNEGLYEAKLVLLSIVKK